MEKFDQIIFLSDCPKFYKNLKDFLGLMGIYSPDRIHQREVDLPKASHLIGYTEQYCVDQISEGEKKDGVTKDTVLLTIKRGVVVQAGRHYETVVTVVKQGDFSVTKVGELVEIPQEIIEKGRTATPSDYKFSHQGFSVKLNNLIKDSYPEDVKDAWDFADNAKFGFRRFGVIGENTIRRALWSLNAHWNASTQNGLCDTLIYSETQRTINWLSLEVRTKFGDLSNVDAIVGFGNRAGFWAGVLSQKIERGVVVVDQESLSHVQEGKARTLVLVDSSTSKVSVSDLVGEFRKKGWTTIGLIVYNYGKRSLEVPELGDSILILN